MATAYTAYRRFTKQGATGIQELTGFGFRPKAVLVWSTYQTALGASDKAQQLFGMMAGANQVCRSILHPDNETATTCGQVEQTDHLFWIAPAAAASPPGDLNNPVGTSPVARATGSFLSDGIALNWIVNDGVEAIIHVIALGGSAVEVDYTHTKLTGGAGSTYVVDVGFAPDCFIVLGGAADEFGGGDYSIGAPYGSIVGFGFSDASTNVTGWTLGRGTNGAADTYKGQHTNRAFSIRTANLSGAGELAGGRITAKSSTGYTITRDATSATQPQQHVLAIKGLQFALGSFNAPTTPGSTELELGLRADLLLLQTHGASEGQSDGMSLAVGAWSRSTGLFGGTWIGGTDGASPSVYARADYADCILQHRTPAATGSSSAVNIQASVTSTTDHSVTLFFPTVPGGTRQILYIAFSPTSEDPVDYENPCEITDPLYLVKIKTEDETLTYSAKAIRDNAVRGGFKEPRVIDIGPCLRAASDVATGAWSAQQGQVVLADTDKVNRARIASRPSFRGADAEYYITSKSHQVAGGAPRIIFSGKVYSNDVLPNLALALQVNDLIGVEYSLFSEEKQIPQRETKRDFFPNVADQTLGIGEPILGGRLGPLDNTVAGAEGIVDCPLVGRIYFGSVAGTPTPVTLADIVAAMNVSGAAGTILSDWGGRIGFYDAINLQSYYDGHGTVPADYDTLAGIIGYSDLDQLLLETATTPGTQYVACLVASHAISEVLLSGPNSTHPGQPSIWIDDTQIDPTEIGVSVFMPQIPGDTSWASTFGSDLFTDIVATDGSTRRYTLVLFTIGSTYGNQVEAGGRVHLDCIGLEDTGDGTGSPLLDYFALYRHVLIQFILQDYQSGPWLAAPTFLFVDGVTNMPRVKESSFDTASAVVVATTLAGGRKGRFKIGDKTSVRDIIQEFNFSGGCRLAQDDFGRLFCQVLDRRRATFLATPSGETHRVLRDKVDILPGFHLVPKPEWQCNYLGYQYAKNYYTNQFERQFGGGGDVSPIEDEASQLVVGNGDRTKGRLKKNADFLFAGDDATALDVGQYYVDLFSRLPMLAQYTRRGLCGLEDDVLAGVPIKHFNDYMPAGTEHAFWVGSKNFTKTMTTDFEALDVEHVLSAFETPEQVALLLDPIGLEELFDDVSGEVLIGDPD